MTSVVEEVLKALTPVPMDPPPLDFKRTGKRIMEARRKLGVSQKELAAAIGVSQPYMCRMEHGDNSWTLDRFALAKASLEKLALLKSMRK